MVPDGDLFKAIGAGRASIVTDHIASFTETGIRLASGRELQADIIVSATGLKLKLFGGIDVTVDGEAFVPSETMTYKGLMVSGVPNFVFTIGYTNASWTLKADLVGEYVVRLLGHMDETGTTAVVPVKDDSVGERPFMDLASGYVQRALDGLPRQGDRAPWALRQNYYVDVRTIRTGKIDDGVLQFT
jgi:cation diffusion facilitator CzcD-associated flavoprotein CzcO